MSTGLRRLEQSEEEGCVILSSIPDDPFLDGSEERLFQILREADDLSSLSDELEAAATSWPELYHLSKSRGNVVRSFSPTHDLAVLEVGAGCGGVTRCLGERCGPVDALEPVLARARVARARTRDLDNVRVYVGSIEDIPAEPTYDLIVVVGVLEYVGEGTADAAPYTRFLQELVRRLRVGGHIVCAIENALGVKYLAGSPEDHSGRVFDGVEGYPRGGHARTFSRAALTAFFRAAGLVPTFYHAFPDFKLPRGILADELFDADVTELSLAWRLPNFPSPDWSGPRAHVADERSLWRSLVEAESGARHANSFVVVASRRATSEERWPSEAVAVYYTTERRAAFATETWVRRSPSGLRFERSRFSGGPTRVEEGGLILEPTSGQFVPGADLLDVLAASDLPSIDEWLRRWRGVVEATARARGPQEPISLELGPHNVVVGSNGELELIDQEWLHRGYTEREVVERSILWLPVFLAERSPWERWPAESVEDLARLFGASVGLDSDGAWITPAVEREARIQAQVYKCSPGSHEWEPAVQACRERLRFLLGQRLADGPLGERDYERRVELERLTGEQREEFRRLASRLAESEETIAELRTLVDEQEANIGERERVATRKQAEIDMIRSSTGYRLLSSYRRAVHALLPSGSRRWARYDALITRVRRWLASRDRPRTRR